MVSILHYIIEVKNVEGKEEGIEYDKDAVKERSTI